MKFVIHGKNIEVTDAIREYVHQKIEKAANHYQNLTTEIDVHLSVAPNPRISASQNAEVTLFVNGSVIRAEESSESLYASIDLVADKIARQLRKYKEKRQDKTYLRTKDELEVPEEPIVPSLATDRQPTLPDEAHEVVRYKYFAMPPMAVKEALEQLDLVDHDFYVFHNSETGQINVIYERNHGGYGLIQPKNGSNGSVKSA
ncbi:ribosome hibernation-promoting factor, HPF/YfiA family [Altericista sp. CCNU0014]|uniref:ribosome hibernation-promoting factor, HPF/YfiA family n=1 Tax=Altericista sp. CCNU0014 TaxID=3082949 RepID=UPI00384D2C3D